jgi:hypothetical protein
MARRENVMSVITLYPHEIRVGDRFEWEGYQKRLESGASPKAYARIEITRIWAWGEWMPNTEREDDQPEAECRVFARNLDTGTEHWNDLSRFREAVTPTGTWRSRIGLD